MEPCTNLVVDFFSSLFFKTVFHSFYCHMSVHKRHKQKNILLLCERDTNKKQIKSKIKGYISVDYIAVVAHPARPQITKRKLLHTSFSQSD